MSHQLSTDVKKRVLFGAKIALRDVSKKNQDDSATSMVKCVSLISDCSDISLKLSVQIIETERNIADI